MSRYILFGDEECYYASGGANDFLAVADSFHELRDRIDRGFDSAPQGLDWWHVWDTQENKIIGGTNCQAYGADSLVAEDGVSYETNRDGCRCEIWPISLNGT